MCGRAGEWEPKVENIVVRIWGKNQCVSMEAFGVRHKFLCLVLKLARYCIQCVIMLQLINPPAKQMRVNWAGCLRSDKPGLGPGELSLSGQRAKDNREEGFKRF